MFNYERLGTLNKEQNEWIVEYRKEKFERFDKLPCPTWKRLKLKDFELPEFKAYNKPFLGILEEAVDKNIVVQGILDGLNEHEELKEYAYSPAQYGVDEKFVTLGEAFYNTGVIVHTPKNAKIKQPIMVNYVLDKENPVVIDHNIIVAEENSEITIIVDYISQDLATGFHNGVTKIFAKKNAVVNVIKIQRMSDTASHFDSNVAYVDRDAKVNWISVELGSGITASSYINNLDEVSSEADLRSIYLGDGERKLDLEYTMNHRGMRSLSNIETRGVLKDKSSKVFRGNLDFKKGARKAKGTEEEYVILLDPTVKSDAIPALLCDEDDVEGQHAASAGQIDQQKLFYLMSRGLSEKEAKKLIVEASFRPILDRIPLEELRNAIDDEIVRRLVNA